MHKILVADDDVRMSTLLTMTLPGNYEVLQASDGEEAVGLAERSIPDLILLDINMPKLNGFEVLRKIRQNRMLQKTKVIVVTARADDADRQLGLNLGADRYLTKPFSPLKLLATVTELLGEQ